MSDQPTLEIKAPPLLKLISENFAVLSSSTFVFAVLCATVFLYAYLSVFDWNLIWIVEYPDILKFGLVAVAIISGFISIIQSLINQLLLVTESKGKLQRQFIIVYVVIVIVFFGLSFYMDSERSPILYIALGLSIALLTYLTVGLAKFAKSPYAPDAFQIVSASFLLAFTIGVFGSTLGFYTKYGPNDQHDLILNDRSMDDVRVVMFTSHHTIVYSEGRASVVRTGDVARLVAHAGASK